MVPWAIWTVLVGLFNLALFVALRGRWGREWPALVAAALLGTALGNFGASLVGVDVLVLGEYHVVGATIGAQLALLASSAAVTLLGASPRSAGGRDGAGSGR
jgi:hypothetical protein